MTRAAWRRRLVALIAAWVVCLYASVEGPSDRANGLDFMGLILVGAAVVYASAPVLRKRW